MTTSNYLNLDCPIAESLSIVGDQWTLLIIRDALTGVSSFTGFEQSLGISRRLLSRRLKEMEESGLIDRVPVKEGAARMKYVPTRKGAELSMVLMAFADWGERWYPGKRGPRYEHTHVPSGKEIHPAMVRSDTGKSVPMQECASLPSAVAGTTSPERQRYMDERAAEIKAAKAK